MVEASIRLLPRAVDDLKNIRAYWRRNITPDEADRITGKILRELKELKLFYTAANSIKYEPMKSRDVKNIKTELGEVHVKMSSGYGVVREKFEYEDIARIAREQGISLADVTKLISKEQKHHE